MCTNAHYVYNKYSRKPVLVSCGKCPACQQEKANRRAVRIRNNVSSGTITLFVTLTYAPDYVPYIKKSDLLSDCMDVPVYRRSEIRYVYDKTNGLRIKKDVGIRQIDSVFIEPSIRVKSNVLSLPKLEGAPKDCVGVCLTSDFQKFVKRLRQYLKNTIKHEIKFSYYQCSEYGSTTQRPHIHALFFIPAYVETTFRRAIIKNWSYADKYRTEKYVELARDAAGYVASYVNSHNLFSEVLQVRKFKQSHSFSLGFGVGNSCFQLVEILQKIEQRDLSYYSEQKFDGTSCTFALPVPQYVINRYFPKFKGVSILPVRTLDSILYAPFRNVSWLADKGFINSFAPQYCYTNEECRLIAVRLENAYQRFHVLTGLGRFDYVYYYKAAWMALFITLTRFCYDGVENEEDLNNFYENIRDVEFGFVQTDFDISNAETDPNKRLDVVEKTSHLIDIFHKKDKSRKVINFIMSSNGHYV